MKVELCHYSGQKIYPGHGKRFVKVDGRVVNYLNSKCQRSADLKRNPREIRWTVLYRRKHRKGQIDQQAKKKTRKVHRIQRGIAGIALSEILARKNEGLEIRKSQRDQAIREAKERRKQKAAANATKSIAPGSQAAKLKAQKKLEKAPRPVVKGGGRKGTQR